MGFPFACSPDPDTKPPMLPLVPGGQGGTQRPGFAPRVIKGGQLDLEDAIKDSTGA